MQTPARPAGIRELLLTRRGLAFVESSGPGLPEQILRAVELELAGLGYVISTKLRERLAQASLEELVSFRAHSIAALSAHTGADRDHKPLFRHFPEGVPDDTQALWWSKVLVHFLQSDQQPCLFCGRRGTTHVLKPCEHVVCESCFDGSNYSACPSCEHRVDLSSPFFKTPPARALPVEKVVFKRIDLGSNLEHEAHAWFSSLCERAQALSPTDREALISLATEYGTRVLDWIPARIPVRENVALVFGTLAQHSNARDALLKARSYFTSATDVLRFIAVLSGTDGSLLKETVFKQIEKEIPPGRFWGRIAELIGAQPPGPSRRVLTVPLRVNRFKVAKLSRSVRRTVLEILESFDGGALTEDLLRHQSYWVWVGQFLHPHEYATRFPKVAHAFQVVREKAPDGTPAPEFQTWNARVESAVRARDSDGMLAVLLERSGEFARRFDLVLRLAQDDATRSRVLAAFAKRVSAFATPVLLTLKAHLPTRLDKAPIRVYWPKGRVARGVSSPDERPPLPRGVIDEALRAIDSELLSRFASKPGFAGCLIDDGLRSIIVPFNERTASRSAVALPRGSRIAIPPGKSPRLFLHWCQPADSGRSSDLDLSVGMYDENWNYVGVCSYYQLEARTFLGSLLARSAGDLRSAPWPDGATEFVDLQLEATLAAGVRYLVMVLNNFAGQPFSQLERAFAGVMFREDPGGAHFDPRTVELKFALEGENGVFLPLVIDLQTWTLHWLDVHAKGNLEFNNVQSSNVAITKICPDQMSYFASGARASMYQLGMLHAAARCDRVWVRRGHSDAVDEFVRSGGESREAFHARLTAGKADRVGIPPPAAEGASVLALMVRGNLELPAGSQAYALFRERGPATLAAADLLS